jgi:hypothetical protein
MPARASGASSSTDQGTAALAATFSGGAAGQLAKETGVMKGIILWLLGVPISVIILLYLIF